VGPGVLIPSNEETCRRMLAEIPHVVICTQQGCVSKGFGRIERLMQRPLQQSLGNEVWRMRNRRAAEAKKGEIGWGEELRKFRV